MSEISRKYQKIFGKNAVSSDLGVLGSKSAGSIQYSTDIETIQSLSNWETGLRSIVTNSDAPYLQDLNSLYYVITTQLAYIFQKGVPEWNASTEYYSGKSFVSRNGLIYKAVANSTGKDPATEPYFWIEYFKSNSYFINSYDSNVATAIGGYPSGAILRYTDTNNGSFLIKSLIYNNTNTPSSSNIKTQISSSSGTYYWEKVEDRKIYPLCIELMPSSDSAGDGGFVDFHYNRSSADYTSRIIEDETGKINIICSNGLKVNGVLLTTLITQNSLGIPNYNAGVSLGTGSGTISNNGWLCAYTTETSGITINGTNISNIAGVSSYTFRMFVPVKAGDTYSGAQLTFYPNR